MAVYQGQNIGTSKTKGILDLYTGNTKQSAYAGFSGSAYSLQPGNGTLGGATIVGGYEHDVDDGIQVGNHSGKFRYEYWGDPTAGHNQIEVLNRAEGRVIEKPDGGLFYGG